MLVILLACSHEPGFGPSEGGPFTVDEPSETNESPGTEWSTSLDVVPIAQQEVLFTVESPYEFYGLSQDAFADLDGNGSTDLLAELIAPHTAGVAPRLQVLVRGPLQAGMSLPSDAWLVLDDPMETFLSSAELTGDDAQDLVVTFGWYTLNLTSWIVPFPFDGNLEPDASWLPVDPLWWNSWSVDADRDGTRDLVVDTTELDEEAVGELRITWGPVERWSGPPDVVVTPVCRDGDIYRYGGYTQVWFTGDIDGDGTPEATVDPFGSYSHVSCGAFTVSLPVVGVIDPFDSALSHDGLVLTGEAAGDWTGDGLPEMKIDDSLLLSPITLSDGDVNASVTIDAISAWESFWMLDFDIGADGVPDAMGTLDADILVSFPADPFQLTDPTVQQGWGLGEFDRVTPFLDQGHGWVALYDPVTSTVRRIDLGPAAPL